MGRPAETGLKRRQLTTQALAASISNPQCRHPGLNRGTEGRLFSLEWRRSAVQADVPLLD